jgi:hypothetical protein
VTSDCSFFTYQGGELGMAKEEDEGVVFLKHDSSLYRVAEYILNYQRNKQNIPIYH